MALKQQTTAPFQLRNPYRLDRPTFDPHELWESARLDNEETERQNLHQKSQRPLPLEPILSRQPLDDARQPSRSGAQSVTNSIKRIKGYRKKTNVQDTAEKHQFKNNLEKSAEPSETTLSGHTQQQKMSERPSDGRTSYQHFPHGHFIQSWFGQSSNQLASSPTLRYQLAAQKQLSTTPKPAIPSIIVTHHIETHTELTFERHVEWLTQTALWWDMPVVHLYPAPGSQASLQYVETIASRFSSWVNFLKIFPEEEIQQRGSPSVVAKASSLAARIKSPRAMTKSAGKNDKVIEVRDNISTPGTPESESSLEGGMVRVRGHVKQNSDSGASVTSVNSSGSKSVEFEPIIGYVFVGSTDEQAQYHHVFETMQGLFPLIEIRYINSFEPQHLQSRQQKELREDPCLHSLSWVHYWSAAKESQVLQSKIVNDVVRVRPMWVNHEYLHRNYAPCQLESPSSQVEDILECPPVVSQSESSLPPSGSVYVGCRGDVSLEESLRGIPSTVSIASLLEMDSILEDTACQGLCERQLRECRDQTKCKDSCLDTSELQGCSNGVIFGRSQSSMDIHIREQGNPLDRDKSSGRRSKKWGYSFGTGNSNRNRDTGYRKSVSAPLLLLTKTKDHGPSSNDNHRKHGIHDTCEMGEHGPDNDNSVPLPSPTSSTSPTSTSSTSSTTSTSSITSSSFSQRLADLAQRLGVYKTKGSMFMVVDL